MTHMNPALLRAVMMRNRQQEIAQAAQIYNLDLSRAQIEEAQLRRFNKVWTYCLNEVPFYQAWAKEHSLPPQLQHIRELGMFPILTKEIVVERTDEIFQQGFITDAFVTGGSTGIPARYPKGPRDYLTNYAQTYAGRNWWDIQPFDPYLHIWGHAHLFGGDGLTGKIQKLKRQVADTLINAVRVNAYDMSPQGLESHYQALLRQNPFYITGYTSAVFKLARHIEAQGGLKQKISNLHAAVVTSETVTQADVNVISRVLGVSVIIEYGSVEMGTMATSRNGSWPLQVLWQTFAIRLPGMSGELNVTTLSDRLFPLINYTVGDRGVAEDIVDGNVLTLAAVTGRNKDVVVMATQDGQPLELSPILPVHILKGEPGIHAVQFRQDTPNRLRIFLAGNGELPLEQLTRMFVGHMQDDHPDFDTGSVVLEQVEQPLLNKKGAQALFV